MRREGRMPVAARLACLLQAALMCLIGIEPGQVIDSAVVRNS